jgi:predicted metal-dependent HD superfamily phosphohydrolase
MHGATSDHEDVSDSAAPDMSELVRSWHGDLPAADEADRSDALARLLVAYDEPHRHFHTRTHVATVVSGVMASAGGDRCARLAAWYHDAIYDPRASDNEARSADLAVATLRRLGVDELACARVHDLILMTKHHLPRTGDEPAAALCDADLGILGTDRTTYTRYVGQVRAEFAHVDDDAWRVGRSAFLRSMLDRPTIFHGSAALDRWESGARGNLIDELAGLTR